MTSLAERAAQLSPQAREVLARELIRAGTVFPVDTVAEPVAVVGIGCRFPGDVVGPGSFWRLLVNGEDAISEVPADRWDADAFYDPDPLVPGRMTTKWGGFVSDVAGFDADFFAISPREAAAMDPQQRMLLEVTWEALEHAGIPPDSLGDTRTGVMMGLSTWDYTIVNLERRAEIDAYLSTGNPHSTAVGRISYLLGLRGPAVAVDTACSSSLVAVHLACQSLRLRETDLALAGGVQLSLSPFTSIALSKWSALSPRGRCRTFDVGADGFVRGEGAGVVVLKRLNDAVRDGDRVLAVVRGSAVNQDGRSNGLTAPNVLAQRDVITDALRAGAVAPDTVNYVESHGTGTVLGDPIEFESLAATYGRGDAPCALGALKTNLGHMEAAAGVAGFIKAVLVLERGQIPPNLHFSRWNPAIDASATRLFVPTDITPWPQCPGPRRAGVSSFGISGTNAHVVLEQAPVFDPVAREPEPVVSTLVVSGKTAERVASAAGMLADWMAGDGAGVGLAEVAHTLNHHRAAHAKFATVAAGERGQAVAGLRALAAGHTAPGVVGPHQGACRAGTVFVYSGQGSQWAGMGRQLLADEPAFAAAVAELEPVFVEQVGFSLQQVLSAGEPLVGIDRIQPVLVGMQLALTELWRCYGVTPDAVIGHSMGEVTAAVVAGALSPADGLKVIATRSRLMARLSGQGAMALLELDAAAAEQLIADYPGLTVAVYASPRQTVIAGPPAQVDAVIAVVDAQDRLARRVDVDVASHHPIIDPVLPDLRTELAGLTPQQPSIPVIVTTGDRAGDGTNVFDAEHWAANLRNPVRFAQAVATAGADHAIFVEVSPHPLLSYAIKDTLAGTHHHSLGTLQRDTNDTLTFHTNLNATHTIRPPELEHPPEPHPVIPTTPWHHARHWIATPEVSEVAHHNGVEVQPVAGSSGSGDVFNDWFYQLAWPIRELPATETRGDGSWLVLADLDVGADLGQLLGMNSRVLAPSVLEEGGDSAGLRDALTGADYVVFAPPMQSRLDITAGYRLFNAVRQLVASLAATTSPPKLFVVTRNAQPIDEGDRANPVHAVLWGLARTLALEHPEFWGGIIDVDDSVPAELIAQYIHAEVDTGDGDDQVVYQSGVRHVPRLERRPTPTVSLTRLESDTSHLVIGATGNVGPYLIRQLAEMGAATIVAVSRRGGQQLEDLATELSSGGTKLIEVAADAADEAAMTALFERFGKDLPPLEGIYLAALAGGEALLSEMTDDDVNTMFRSKLDVASVLHKLSLKTPVRRFVFFSSITGILGSRWLGHYTAAGAFLDTFAYARRALGLAATVVDWGLWNSWADAQPATTAAGLQPMPNEMAIRMLPAVLSPDGGVQSAVVAADWSRLAEAYRMRGSLRVVDHLLTDDAVDAPSIDHVAAPRLGTLLGEQVATTAPAHLWQARLVPETKPYPGEHRVQGVDVVPASVLLQTLSVAAAECGASILSNVRFEYPIVVDHPRVIHVVANDDSVTVSSGPGAETPAHRWVRHVSARISARLPDDVAEGTDTNGAHEVPGYDPSSVAKLQRAWGIEGQPFGWSIGSCRSAPAGFHADVSLPEASTVALLDAAVHVARLADTSNPQLMFPAAIESVWFAAELADAHGSVEVRRRGGNGDELVVDIAMKAPDGSTCVDIRGLRYAAVESAPVQAAPETSSPPVEALAWSQMSREDMVGELEIRLRAILASELGMPASAVGTDQAFPELGLDSMMAMNLLREAKQLVGIDLSATMLWNNPTTSSLAAYLAELLATQKEPEEDDVDVMPESEGSVLDALFDSVEAAPAGSESGIR